MTIPSTADSHESSPTKIEPATDPAVTRRSATHADVKGEVSPRLPHEHDESSSSVSAVPDPRVQQAAADVQSGKTPTDRGEVTDALYARTLRDSEDRSDGPGQAGEGHAVDRR